MSSYTKYILSIISLCFMVIGCNSKEIKGDTEVKVRVMDLSKYPDTKPEKPLKLLFIHHSCGGQWLASFGEYKDYNSNPNLYGSCANGGGLRDTLIRYNYEVHEATYQSKIGDNTDVCDWNNKFKTSMDQVLRCDVQDTFYNDSASVNDIIMFKSCYPANNIQSEGKEPGDPDSKEKTTANYKASYNNLLKYFKAHPNTLFICVTAPPLAPRSAGSVKEIFRRLTNADNSIDAIGRRARRFNNWLKDTENGWLAGYQGKNVVVFDYYNILTRNGESNFSLYPTKNGKDSHPSAEGNSIATREFIPFINRAVNRLHGSERI